METFLAGDAPGPKSDHPVDWLAEAVRQLVRLPLVAATSSQARAGGAQVRQLLHQGGTHVPVVVPRQQNNQLWGDAAAPRRWWGTRV